MNPLANAGQLLVHVIFGVATALFLLRLLLQRVHANFYNPVCQFLYKATHPVLGPLRRVVPSWRNLDLPALLVAWLLTALKLALLYALAGMGLGLGGLALMAVADLADLVLVIYIALVLVRVLLSFVRVERGNPVVPLVYQLTDPVLGPIQRLLPALGGLDFSPIVAWLGIMLLRILLVEPLRALALAVAAAG